MVLDRPQLVLRYKADVCRNGLLIMAALSPLWLIWLPLSICALGAAFLQGAEASLFWLLAYSALFLACIGTILVCLDNRLIVALDGITVPVRYVTRTGPGRKRLWRDLSGIVCRRLGVPHEEPDEMLLQFERSLPVPIKLDGLSRDDLKAFLLALEAYCPDAAFDPPLHKLRIGGARLAGAENVSFTRMWEEDLNNRFGSTIFVPKEAGDTLQDGRLTIAGQVAFGGFSAVYLASTAGGDMVVVKESVVPLNCEEESRRKASDMFDREAEILCRLKHPRIARVYDHFVEDGRNYLLLEYIQGRDLRQYVKEMGPQAEDVVLRWTKEVAEVLSYLHTQTPPIIHRDLTPDNLVLASDGGITIIDFGAANSFLGAATGTLVGKQSYISPEQFRGRASPASDLYSLGCTMHYLLTGEDPQPLDTSHPRELQESVSAATDRFVARLTELETENRFQSAFEVAHHAGELIRRQARRTA